MKQNIVIGSRESKLAVIQSEMVQSFIKTKHPDWDVSIMTMKTTGDMILNMTLDKIGGKGLFVKELDRALLEKRSTLSVHSLKDVPMEISEKLPLVAFSKREDPRDALILPKGIDEIDFHKPIGCSSNRRILQLGILFPQAVFKSIRGNVQSRLAKLDSGQYSATVLAVAGLKRLGMENRISRYFTTEEMIPAAGQGILAVQGLAGQDYNFLNDFNDKEANAQALCERAFVRELHGGCSSPTAAYTTIEGGTICLTGLYFNEETKKHRIGKKSGVISDAEKIGISLAQELSQGGRA